MLYRPVAVHFLARLPLMLVTLRACFRVSPRKAVCLDHEDQWLESR